MRPTLVVLAAGLGSRYGSLKQIDQFGPSGETIIDYSIYDAINAGFGKVVFVIRKDIEREFKEVFLGKYGARIEVAYVFQELTNLPKGLEIAVSRQKPWGTGHAVWVAAEKVDGPFAVINADDFYGTTSFHLLFKKLDSMKPDELEACLIGYRVKNTLSEHGSVSRGICSVSSEHHLLKVVERTQIFQEDGQIYFKEDGTKSKLTGEEIVSMNLMGFTPPFFDVLRQGFMDFVSRNEGNAKAEYFLPSALDSMIKEHKVPVPVIETPERSYGVTYRKDKQLVMEMINRKVIDGLYPKKLW